MSIILLADANVWLLVPALGAIITAILSAAGGWFISKQIHSGKIETSSASDLWKESRAIRESLRAQNDALQEDLEGMHAQVLEMKLAFEKVKTELVESQEDRRRMRIELQTLRDENEMLRTSNRAMSFRITDLEAKVPQSVSIHTTVESQSPPVVTPPHLGGE